MTDTAVRPSIARIMPTDALLGDLGRVRAKLEYLDALEEFDGVLRVVDGSSAPASLVTLWDTLAAEARERGFSI